MFCQCFEVAQTLIKKGFFISEGQKGRGELEEPSLVSRALFCCSQAEQIEPMFPDRMPHPVLSDLVWSCVFQSHLDYLSEKKKKKKPPSFYVELFEFIVPSQITSAASISHSPRVECLMNRRILRQIFGWLLSAPKTRALYIWHFSPFSLHLQLSATVYCTAKMLSAPAACKWYISPNSWVIKHSDLNFKKSFRTCVRRNCCWIPQTA